MNQLEITSCNHFLNHQTDQAHQTESLPEEDRDGRRRNDHQEEITNGLGQIETKFRRRKIRTRFGILDRFPTSAR